MKSGGGAGGGGGGGSIKNKYDAIRALQKAIAAKKAPQSGITGREAAQKKIDEIRKIIKKKGW